ncbi:DNA polymerase phi subunit [Blastomyces silverae]|uniref:DNA polymerase phi subunit n=1 Tax=Blastomyces silverae TaxID=2060906 RepID=A0A0H1BNA7_9EURO|nr:DNA polymerase phi subunit [Blastomyces silverae]
MASFPPPSRKRRREPVNVDVKLVEIYEDLANENDEIRLKAAQRLVSRFTPDQNPTDEQIEKTLQRLFRGLCSGRKAARIGFSIALTETLSQVFSSSRDPASSSLGVSRAIEIWEAQSNPGGSASGQEERDHHFGRLFGAEALIKSSVLFQSQVPFEEWIKILATLFDLAKKKPWLREECGWIIFCSLREIQTHKFDVKYAEAALDSLCQNGLAKTPEGVAIWIAAKDLFPSMKFPEAVWQHGSPLHVREKASLAKIMKETSESQSEHGKENGKAQNSGVWNAKLHFAWDIVLQKLSTQPSGQNGSPKTKDSKATQASFTDIWTEVVDNGLFAAASSEERKYWGFLLFIKTMNEAPPHLAATVFTKNLMRCFMNQLAVEDRYLHRIATKALKSVQARVTREPEFIVAAINGLMGPTGAVNFDHITKTKTVEKMISAVSADTLKEIIPLFESMIARPGMEDVKAAASTRQQLTAYLLSVVRTQASAINAVVSDELQSSIESVLLLLARFAYFLPNENDKGKQTPAEPPVTEATQELFRNRLMSCLNVVISGRKSPAAIPYAVVRKIHEMDLDGGWGKFVIEMGEDIKGSVAAAFKTLKKLTSKEKRAEKKEGSSIQAFKLLYSMTILQVYNGDGDAVSMLDELKFCYSKFLGHKSKRDEANEASDALVEILLSFASKQSQLFRRMSEQVFGAFADQVTATGLQSLVDVLETKDTLAGQEEMFESQEVGSDIEMVDAENSDDDDDDDDEDEDDVEVISQASSDDGEDESEEESEEEDDDELQAFEAKLASALGTHRADKDINAASSDSEDASMDDDEMEALDDQIAKVFRARKQVHSKKKEQKDARETMLNFKNRVLDLLEIYVKKCHSNILALDLLMPLLQLSRKSRTKQIATRASNVLREYTKQCKGAASIPSIESAEPVWELLKAVHQEATHSAPAAHASSCSQASLLLVKILVAHDKESLSGIVDIYADTRKKQLTSKKCHVQPSFFSDWNNWCVSASKQMKE